MFSRRDALLALALTLGLAALWLLAGPGGGEDGAGRERLSSFRTSPGGAGALYLALRELEIPVARGLTGYAGGGPPAEGALALLAPAEPPTPRELASLGAWVEAGGTLLYAARRGDPTLDTLGLELRGLAPDTLSLLRRAEWEGVAVRPRPHRWTRGLATGATTRFAFSDSSRALSAAGAAPLLVTTGGDVAVATFRRGRGTVVAWSDPALLSNGTLRGDGRPLVFARAAAEATADGDSLVFDEYHQGYRAGGGPVSATVRFVRETGPGRAALQAALAGLGLLLLAGRRFGSPVETREGRRRSPLEHVDALSAAYRRAGARATARRLLVAGLARRLGRELPEAGSAGAFLGRLARSLPVGRDEARRLEEEWRKGEGADLAALARGVDDLVSAAAGRRRSPADEEGD